MIYGIGTDIISIKRINNMLNKHKDKFPKRILSKNEMKIYNNFNNNILKISYLAKRFSAKEAISKAIGYGIGENFSFKDISIENYENGKPFVNILNSAISKFKIHISVSDEKFSKNSNHDIFAQAFAVAEL